MRRVEQSYTFKYISLDFAIITHGEMERNIVSKFRERKEILRSKK